MVADDLSIDNDCMGQFITCGNTSGYCGHLLSERIGKNIVAGIGGVLLATGVVVGRCGINRVTYAGWESNLGYQERLSTRIVDVYVDVWCPPRVPAGEYARKAHLAIGIAYLTPTQEVNGGEIGLLHARTAVFRVVAVLVAVPDVDNGTSQGFAASIEIFDVDFDTQWYTRTIRTDVNHL